MFRFDFLFTWLGDWAFVKKISVYVGDIVNLYLFVSVRVLVLYSNYFGFFFKVGLFCFFLMIILKFKDFFKFSIEVYIFIFSR